MAIISLGTTTFWHIAMPVVAVVHHIRCGHALTIRQAKIDPPPGAPKAAGTPSTKPFSRI